MKHFVDIRDRVAIYVESRKDEPVAVGDNNPVAVGDNTGDKVVFTFDAEWDEFSTKTALFVWNGKDFSVEFSGNECEVPEITNATKFLVGVYVGDGEDPIKRTTTSAQIPCQLSIRSKAGTPHPSAGKNYTNEAKGYAIRAENAAKRAEDALEEFGQVGGGTGIGITRKHITGSGDVTINVQDQYVYYVDGYSNISVNLPSGDFTAHFFVKFPEDALSCSFNIPDGVATFGNNLAECDFGESWEISIDGVGGALALRKRGL